MNKTELHIQKTKKLSLSPLGGVGGGPVANNSKEIAYET